MNLLSFVILVTFFAGFAVGSAVFFLFRTPGLLKSIFCEADGTGSFARISGGVALLAVIGWVSYIVLKTLRIPDNVASLTALVSGSYVANQVQTAVSSFSSKDGDAKPPTVDPKSAFKEG